MASEDDDLCAWKPYFGKGDASHIDEYNKFFEAQSVVLAVVNLIQACLLSAYVVMQCCRRSKLNRISWFGMIAFCVATFTTGIALIVMKANDQSVSNCDNYLMGVLLCMDDLLVYNLTLYIGYHIYLIVYDVDQFVQTRNLAIESAMSKRKVLIIAVWVVQLLAVSSYTIVHIVWAFTIPDQRQTVQTFELVARAGEASVYLCCSVTYLSACRLIKRIRQLSPNTQKQNRVHDQHYFIWVFRFMAILCLLLFLNCTIKILLFGYYTLYAIVNEVVYKVCFNLQKIALFIMLARWNLRLKL